MVADVEIGMREYLRHAASPWRGPGACAADAALLAAFAEWAADLQVPPGEAELRLAAREFAADAALDAAGCRRLAGALEGLLAWGRATGGLGPPFAARSAR